MDSVKLRSKHKGFSRWFRRKHKKPHDPYDSEGGNYDHTNDESPTNLLTNELRIFVGTWNVAGKSPVGSLAVDLEDWLNLKDAADLYVLGSRFQEIVPLNTQTVIGVEDPKEAMSWNMLIGKTLNDEYGCRWLTSMSNSVDNYQYVVTHPSERVNRSIPTGNRYNGNEYKIMASKKMVGVFISVWMKNQVLKKYCVSNVKLCSVPCGIMGYLGNKGSVSVSMSIEGTAFCFIAAHLASGEKKGDEVRRNQQVYEIFKRTNFAPSYKGNKNHHPPLTIPRHDKIFWFGDLNYRLYLEDNLARHLIKKKDWIALQKFDQLHKELEDGGVFHGWREGNIEFAPTYKYASSNSNRYSGGLPGRSGEKQRTPACQQKGRDIWGHRIPFPGQGWCDRILWHGKGVRQLSYIRSESKFSDHRPVSALFSTEVEVERSSNKRITAKHTILRKISTSKPYIPSNSSAEGKST